MSMRTIVFFCAGGFAALTLGCAAKGPSYAELVTIYNTELEVLERLERKKATLVAEYEAATKSKRAEAMESLQGVLDSAQQALKDSPISDVVDPNELLDQVAGQQGAARDLTDGLLGAITGEKSDEELTPEEKAARETMKREFETKLAAVDAEIADQQQRVDKARAARDAAEAP
jgi:hypothetical protein